MREIEPKDPRDAEDTVVLCLDSSCEDEGEDATVLRDGEDPSFQMQDSKFEDGEINIVNEEA